MTTTTLDAFDYRPSANVSQFDRDVSLAALRIVEDALADPAPGRETAWLESVSVALDVLAQAVDTQGATDHESSSLLSEISLREPRLQPRIDRLRHDHLEVKEAIDTLAAQVSATPRHRVDVTAVRDRLASAARRFRQHRAEEADLVYEAVNIDLGGGG